MVNLHLSFFPIVTTTNIQMSPYKKQLSKNNIPVFELLPLDNNSMDFEESLVNLCAGIFLYVHFTPSSYSVSLLFEKWNEFPRLLIHLYNFFKTEIWWQ